MTARVTVVYGGFWRRFSALLIDWVLLSAAWGTIALVTHGNQADLLGLVFAAIYVVGLTAEGGTIGKRMLRLRVVRSDGRPVGVGRAAVRELVIKPVSAAIFFLGFLWATLTRRRQTWHDLAVDTVVVHERFAPPAPEWSEAPPWTVKEPAASVAPAPAPVPPPPQIF